MTWTSDNPKFPKHIRIQSKSLQIDGKEFPWYISEDGPRVSGLSWNGLPMVTVDIPADRIEIDFEGQLVPPAPEKLGTYKRALAWLKRAWAS